MASLCEIYSSSRSRAQLNICAVIGREGTKVPCLHNILCSTAADGVLELGMTRSYTIAEMIWKRMAREIECILLAGHWKHKQSEVVLLAGCEHGGQPTVRQQRLGLSHPKKHSQNSHPFGPRSRLTAEISEADMTVRIAPDFSIRSILSLTQSIAVIQSQSLEIGRPFDLMRAGS